MDIFETLRVLNGATPNYKWSKDNPFATGAAPTQGGLLGGVFAQPAYRLKGSEAERVYAQMAAPYAQWAAQQLKAVAPEQAVATPAMQWADPQQMALASMWEEYNRQQRARMYEQHTN